jgi:hypothetical protein
MSDVFISYKRRLRPQVERIADALRALGLDVWFDAELEPGDSFSAEIGHEVRNAGCVLVCWSNDAFPHGGDENGWVLGEASIGRKRGRLVTVLLEETEFDPPWNMIHTERLIGFDPADMTADRSAWRGTLAAIGRLIERPGLADYDRAAAAGTADALKAWVEVHPQDLLAEKVWARVEEMELAAVRMRLAEQRVKRPDSTTDSERADAPKGRIYAPLPELVLDEAAGVAGTADPQAKPGSLRPALAAAAAAALCAIGAAIAAIGVGTLSEGPLFNTIAFGGPAASMILIAALLAFSGHLTLWRAAILALVGYVGFYLAVYVASFLTRSAPSFGTEGADIAGGFAMGAVGALFVLFTLLMLGRNPNLARGIPIALSGVLLVGIATAVTMTVPGVSLHQGNFVIWGAPVWYIALGGAMAWMLAEPQV